MTTYVLHSDIQAGWLLFGLSLVVLGAAVIWNGLRASESDAAESKALSILTESPEAKSARLSLVPPLNDDAETLALVIGLDFLDRSERVIPSQRRGGEFS